MIIFMGVAGSGKSTMGQLLAAHLACPWISTGNLLRQKMDPKTQAKMLKGEIIKDDLTIGVLENEFQRIDARSTEFVLDGAPRTMLQAKWLAAKDSAGELKITAVIHLNVAKKVAKKRLLSRHRPDDHEEAIAARFSEYDNAIVPMLDYLKSQGYSVYEIDGETPPEKVETAIEKALKL